MTIDLQIGDNREVLLKYPDNHFDCVVTSPPYWALRDYNTLPLIFDGDPNCEHEWINNSYIRNNDQTAGEKQRTNKGSVGRDTPVENAFCSKCKAWRGQLGMEPTPELYIKHLVDTFDIVKNKLKNEGTCFVNLGDTFATHTGKRSGQFGTDINAEINSVFTKNRPKVSNVPEKCLCLIPSRFAWEMIQHGWILRNKIVWFKNNHMPEPFTDRFTRSYEVVLFFVKQQKYFFNLDAVREPHKFDSMKRALRGSNTGNKYGRKVEELPEKVHSVTMSQERDYKGYSNIEEDVKNGETTLHPLGKNPGEVWQLGLDDLSETELKLKIINLIQEWKNLHPEDWNMSSDVFNISNRGFKKAHFATFPLSLIEKPILAGCPVNGWVLDPFAGSGTVGEFCINNYRNAVLIELNEEYKPLIVDKANLKQISLSKIFSFVK